MGYSPENEAQESQQKEAQTEEDQNKAVREKFNALKKKGPVELTADGKISTGLDSVPFVNVPEETKYSEKDTEKMVKKVEEINKDKRYTAHKTDFSKPLEQADVEDEAVALPTPCMSCNKMGVTRICTCSIPYFKEIIVIAFTCEHCLRRTCEVKTGGAVSDKGTVYTIKVTEPDHLNRDMFKSETAEIEIPEIGCTVVSGSLGGVFSTVEGVLEKVDLVPNLDVRVFGRR